MNRLKQIRNQTGLSQYNFAKKYGIPVRSIENWETNVRTPPEYVLNMLEKIIESDLGRFEVQERFVYTKDLPTKPKPGCTYSINVNYDPVRQFSRFKHLQQALAYMKQHSFCLEKCGDDEFAKDYLLFETEDGEIVGEVLAWSTENGIQWN